MRKFSGFKSDSMKFPFEPQDILQGQTNLLGTHPSPQTCPCTRLLSTNMVADSTCASMIFVPCRDGVSHNPAEYSTPEDCANGAQVLMGAVLRYDVLRADRGTNS